MPATLQTTGLEGVTQVIAAPVGLMFTVDRELKIGSWLDYGMFIQNVMLAAKEKAFTPALR